MYKPTAPVMPSYPMQPVVGGSAGPMQPYGKQTMQPGMMRPQLQRPMMQQGQMQQRGIMPLLRL